MYLSPSIKTMRYAKNCGNHMIHKSIKNPDLKIFTFEVEATHEHIQASKKKKESKIDKVLKNNYISIKFDDLDANKKYYGIVVAQVDLFPKGEGYLTPVRSGKAYYDEFTIVTPRLVLPIQLIISCLIIFGFLASMFCVVKSYIFGNINQLNMIGEKIPESLREYDDESSFGFKAFSLLERAYQDEVKRDEYEEDNTAASQGQEDSIDLENGESIEQKDDDSTPEIELQETDDKTQPLDG